jgi:hypothetical protein
MTATRMLVMRFQPLLVATSLLVIPGQVHALQQSAGVTPVRRDYPLNCRGQLIFDTIGPHADTGTVLKLSLTFTANPIAAGPEGQGLQPSTCAWVDRPVNAEEPRQLRMTIGISDSAPQATVRDTGMYWGFLAHNSDSGYITAVGYRHWQASSPPLGLARPASAPSPAPAPSKGAWLPFNPRYLLWFALGWVVIAWVPMLALTGRWSGWRRLARLYPHRSTGRGGSFRAGPLLMGLTNYRGGARLTADDSHIHFSMGAFLRPGHPPFSVPWSDVTVSRDTWPWFPLKGHPVIRLTLAKHRGLRMLLPVKDGERIVAASRGRLQLSGPSLPPPGPANPSRPRAAETPTSSRR